MNFCGTLKKCLININNIVCCMRMTIILYRIILIVLFFCLFYHLLCEYNNIWTIIIFNYYLFLFTILCDDLKSNLVQTYDFQLLTFFVHIAFILIEN